MSASRVTLAILDAELRVSRRDPRIARTGVAVRRRGADVYVSFAKGRDGKPGTFKLGCMSYDAQPPSVTMVHPRTLKELSQGEWSSGVPHSVHPVTGKPFVCLQGIAEYHSHPSHLSDSWDRYRSRIRIRETIIALLQKAGVPS